MTRLGEDIRVEFLEHGCRIEVDLRQCVLIAHLKDLGEEIDMSFSDCLEADTNAGVLGRVVRPHEEVVWNGGEGDNPSIVAKPLEEGLLAACLQTLPPSHC
jgi:hypothetical protein